MRVEDIETVWTALLNQSPTFLADYKRDSSVWQVKTFRTMQHRNSVTWSLISDTRFFTDELNRAMGWRNVSLVSGRSGRSLNRLKWRTIGVMKVNQSLHFYH